MFRIARCLTYRQEEHVAWSNWLQRLVLNSFQIARAVGILTGRNSATGTGIAIHSSPVDTAVHNFVTGSHNFASRICQSFGSSIFVDSYFADYPGTVRNPSCCFLWMSLLEVFAFFDTGILHVSWNWTEDDPALFYSFNPSSNCCRIRLCYLMATWLDATAAQVHSTRLFSCPLHFDLAT